MEGIKMANTYINLYKNNPTAGGTDGTAISTDGEYTSPLTVTLDASLAESKKVKLAIRTESGYQTTGDTTISDYGDTTDKWKLSLTEDGAYSDSITITDTITTTNTIFWVEASSTTTEKPRIDSSVSLRVTTTIEAV